MTLILTVPDRLAIMCEDVDNRIVKAFKYVPNDIDQAMRPAFLVKVDEATFPQVANSVVEPEETYVMDYIGQKYQAGEDDVWEKLTREIADKFFTYFFGRTQLQFTNT